MVKQYDDAESVEKFEERVRAALHREADAVDPSAHALDAIRARTRRGAAARARGRWFAGGAAVLASAAAVAAIAVVGSTDFSGDGRSAGPAGSPPPTQPVQVFYLDRTPEQRGEPGSVSLDEPGLYLEVHEVPLQPNGVEAAVRELLSSTPADPDYVNPWSGVPLRSVEVRSGHVIVDVGSPVTQTPGMHQQLAHTVRQALGQDVAVTLSSNGVEGPTFTAAPPVDAYAAIWVTTPEQGATVDSPVAFSGMAATFEGNVAYEIRRGGEVVATDATTSSGGMGVWSQWSFTERLQPGEYTLVAFTEDPALGGRRDIDTKDFTVQ